MAVEQGKHDHRSRDEITILTPPIIPTFSRSSWTPSVDRLIFRRWFVNIYKHLNWSKTILFVSSSHWWAGFVDRGVLSPALVVYDKQDSLLVPSRTHRALQVMREAEQRLIRDADIITYSAFEMKKELAEHVQHQTFQRLPNAVSSDLHSPSLRKRPTASRQMKRIGFIGSVDERWVDITLICDAANAFPLVEFVMIGPASRKVTSRLLRHNNIHLLGAMSQFKIGELLPSFDVALIPFLINEITRVVNPLKLYEYCAGGMPIVASCTDELRHYSDLIYLAESKKEYLESIQNALDENDLIRQEKRKAFANENRWDDRVELLSQLIDQKIPPELMFLKLL